MHYTLPNCLTTHGCCVVDADGATALTRSGERFGALVLCCSGHADVELNTERATMEPSMWLACGLLWQMHVSSASHETRFVVVAIADDTLRKCSAAMCGDALQRLLVAPPTRIDDAALWSAITISAQALANYLNSAKPAPEAIEAMLGGLLAMLAVQAPQSGANSYFRQFVGLVGVHAASEHEVAFYAQRLGITPKYLAMQCRVCASRTPKEIIAIRLLRELKRELGNTQRPLKDIAEAYGFANQSSLGKFFRKCTGMSPMHYRQH